MYSMSIISKMPLPTFYFVDSDPSTDPRKDSKEKKSDSEHAPTSLPKREICDYILIK